MKAQLEQIRRAAKEALASFDSAEQLEKARIQYLGKKGELTAILKQMGKLSAEERPVIGQLANEIRKDIENRELQLFLFHQRWRNSWKYPTE